MATAKRKQPKVVRVALDFGEKTASTTRIEAGPVWIDYPAMIAVPEAGNTGLFRARDPEGGTIAYSKSTTLTGVTIDSSTGVLTCLPPDNSSAQAGNVTVTATASGTGYAASVVCYVSMAAGPIV
jgi:hypothetical protein